MTLARWGERRKKFSSPNLPAVKNIWPAAYVRDVRGLSCARFAGATVRGTQITVRILRGVRRAITRSAIARLFEVEATTRHNN